MKNKWLKIGGVTLFAGLLMAGISFGMLGFDISKLNTVPPLSAKELSFENHNQNIIIEDKNMPFRIEKSFDEKIHITYYESTKESYSINDTENISFSKKSKKDWYDHFFYIDFQRPTFTILLPDNFSGNININTSNAGVYIENMKSALLSIHTSNGPIKLINTTILEDATLTTDNGKIQFSNLTLSGDANLKTANASITGNILGEEKDFSITAKTSNASCNLPKESTKGSQNLAVKTSNGTIEVTFLNE